jgi:hypothetical protein
LGHQYRRWLHGRLDLFLCHIPNHFQHRLLIPVEVLPQLNLALPQNLWIKGSNISRMEAFGFFAFPT